MGEPGFPPQGVGIPVLFWGLGDASLPRRLRISLASLGGRASRPSPHGSLFPHAFLVSYFRRRRSAATNTAKTTEMTPFMVKKAALSLERSVGLTRECS